MVRGRGEDGAKECGGEQTSLDLPSRIVRETHARALCQHHAAAEASPQAERAQEFDVVGDRRAAGVSTLGVSPPLLCNVHRVE
jgi:hypothetical protein